MGSEEHASLNHHPDPKFLFCRKKGTDVLILLSALMWNKGHKNHKIYMCK